MANSEKKPTNKKIFDVSKPGKTAAHPTGRPVIVGHGSIIQDPMVQEAKEDSTQKQSEPLAPPSLSSSKPKVVEPPADEDGEKAKPEEKQPPQAEEKDTKEAQPQQEAESPAPEDEAEADNTDEKAKSTDEKPPELSKEELARQAEVEKEIASKKYFLPIKEPKRRRHSRALVLSLLAVIIIAAVALDLLLDAGIIKSNAQPLTNLFN